jgi:hypothetical protein
MFRRDGLEVANEDKRVIDRVRVEVPKGVRMDVLVGSAVTVSKSLYVAMVVGSLVMSMWG